MKYCNYCYAELEDDVLFCTECGNSLKPDDKASISNKEIPQNINSRINQDKKKNKPNKVNGLGIASLVLGIIGVLLICCGGIGGIFGGVGLLLGILGLTVLKECPKGLAIAGTIISAVAFVAGIFIFIMTLVVDTDSNPIVNNSTSSKENSTIVEENLGNTKEDTSAKEDKITTKEESNTAKEETSTTKKETTVLDNVKHVKLGETFGNKTISGMVTEIDLDSDNYNDLWTKVEEGYKAVYIKIKVTNISNSSNYVSVGDFDCYADDIIVSPELVSNGNEDYNANIEAGRSAILGALYIVPKDTKKIELEYNPFGEFAERQIIEIQDETTTETHIIVEGELSNDSSAMDNVKVVNIGEEFGNSTITGTVTDVNLDFKNYNDLWSSVDSDHKVVYIKIKVTNISEADNYVSVGDFSCYVDDVSVNAELVSGGSEDYNANIAPGRSAILGAAYIVPKDAQSIELEYDPIGEYSKRVIIKIQ